MTLYNRWQAKNNLHFAIEFTTFAPLFFELMYVFDFLKQEAKASYL